MKHEDLSIIRGDVERWNSYKIIIKFNLNYKKFDILKNIKIKRKRFDHVGKGAI